ncbi:succinate dehydrogenase [Halodesulfurarchaeum formicicum]|uniref:succinate dehydrogenase n=1 Tax=Halodesulfurarchaeum formicicum TaxID=1873524 RepID=UPI0008783BA3|nr:succinate dehydrogenase [Halodesulfurarchaeum formicicum]
MTGSRSTFRHGSLAWFLQRVTAVVLLFTLAFHFLWLHFVNHAAEVTLWGSALRMDRLSYLLLMVVFLLTAAFHGINGIYNALVNEGLSGRARRVTAWVLAIAGTILVVQGLRVSVALAGVVN